MPTAREAHSNKITVYLSRAELLALEDARLVLMREHGIDVDRGRMVREAIGALVDDLTAQRDRSVLVQRLQYLAVQ